MSVSQWVEDRVPTGLRHLDAAACGRISTPALEAEQAHLRAEAVDGGYVAEAAVQPLLDEGRAALGALVGLGRDDVFYVDGAATAFQVLLDAWPLPAGARVGTAPGEYGGNALVLRDRAALRGWELVELPVDPLGRVTDVPTGLDLISLAQVASQRGVVQPAADVIAAGVPVILDVAQAAGQTAVAGGAAAYVGTARKWLCGPRGIGWGAVSAELNDPPTLNTVYFPGQTRRFDSGEPHVAGRVAFAHAARAWSPALLPVVQAGAAAARVLLEGAGGWSVVEPVEEASGITTLRHDTADPYAVRAALLEQGFLTSVVPTSRAAEVDQALLRVSTAAWVTPGDLEALSAALESVGSPA